MLTTETKNYIHSAFGLSNVIYDAQKVREIVDMHRNKTEKDGYGFSSAFIESNQKNYFNLRALEREEVEKAQRANSKFFIGGISFTPPKDTIDLTGVGKKIAPVRFDVVTPNLSTILANNARARDLPRNIPVKMIVAYMSKELNALNYSTFQTSDKAYFDLQTFSVSLEDFEVEHGVSEMTGYFCQWDQIVQAIAH